MNCLQLTRCLKFCVYPGSHCTKKHYITVKLNILYLKSCEIQSNHCAWGGVFQVCHLQAILPLIVFLGIEVCRPLMREMSRGLYVKLERFQSILSLLAFGTGEFFFSRERGEYACTLEPRQRFVTECGNKESQNLNPSLAGWVIRKLGIIGKQTAPQ